MRFVKTVCCAVALAACLAPGARADEWNKKTILTFSGPVQIPGATLSAGTYVFKLADLASNRHVVQVFDKDEKKIYATILAIPDQKLEPSDKPVVMFSERPAGVPQAVKAWFYPGETTGNEFVDGALLRVGVAATQIGAPGSSGKPSRPRPAGGASRATTDCRTRPARLAETPDGTYSVGVQQPIASWRRGGIAFRCHRIHWPCPIHICGRRSADSAAARLYTCRA